MASADRPPGASRAKTSRRWLENPAFPIWLSIADLLLIGGAWLLSKIDWPTALVVHLIGFSLVALFLFGLDKWKARTQRRRVSEWNLLAVTVLGGGFGAFAAMLAFRHKGRHLLFQILVPASAFVQLCLMVAVLVQAR